MSFFRVDQPYNFTDEFMQREFFSLVNELFLHQKTSYFDLIEYLDKEHDAIIFDSGGNVMLCFVKLGGPYWLSISDETYVLYSSNIKDELDSDDSVLILQGDYHDC